MQYGGPFYINASLYRLFRVYFLSIGICLSVWAYIAVYNCMIINYLMIVWSL